MDKLGHMRDKRNLTCWYCILTNLFLALNENIKTLSILIAQCLSLSVCVHMGQCIYEIVKPDLFQNQCITCTML